MSAFHDIARESKGMENSLQQGLQLQTQGAESRVNVEKNVQSVSHQVLKGLGMSLGEKTEQQGGGFASLEQDRPTEDFGKEQKPKRAPTKFPSMDAHQATAPQEQISRGAPPLGSFQGDQDLLNDN